MKTRTMETMTLGMAGVYLAFDESGQQVTSTPVLSPPQEAAADTLIDFSGASIRPRFIDPSDNIALADLESTETKVFLPQTGGEVSVTYGRSGRAVYRCLFGAQNAPINKAMLDGDPTTSNLRIFRQDPTKAPGRHKKPSHMLLKWLKLSGYCMAQLYETRHLLSGKYSIRF